MNLKDGKVLKAILDENGTEAPYNGASSFSMNTDVAKNLGYEFTSLHDWIYDLLDEYIEMVKN